MNTRVGERVEHRGIWRRFFNLCSCAGIPYKLLALYIVLNMGESFFLVMIPQINADFFTGDASVKSISAFLGAELLSVLISQVVLYVNHKFRYKTDRNLRNAVWQKLLDMKPSYFDRVSANTLLSRITIDTSSLNEFIMDVILEIFFSIYMLVLTINEMSGISLKASFYLLAFVPLTILISYVMGRLKLKIENSMKYEMSNLTEYLSELVATLSVVKTFNRQKYEAERGRKVIERYYKANRNNVILDFASQCVGTAFGILPNIVIIIVGIRFLNNGTLDAAGWYIFWIYSGTLLSFASSLGGLWESTKAIQGKLNMVSDIIYEQDEAVDKYVEQVLESDDIIFDDVSFSYGDAKALDHVSFTIPKNQTTGLVGFSGSGKSTIVKLIERIYDPNEGKILLKGKELKDYSLKDWREKVSLVSQNSPMMSGTIRENILYGIKREVSDDEIMEKAELAAVAGFLRSCPDGLDHQVGQFGEKLSGGQRQKLSIVRALLSEPEYLILDEPTASLDILSTNEVASIIDSLKGKMTILVIAHHAAVLKNADHIIYIDSDHHAVDGSRQELLDNSEFYSKLMMEGGDSDEE